jgi:hypothetical protein
MANRSGNVYGLTILSPILEDAQSRVSHNLAIRLYLSELDKNENSPFAKVSSTHLARLVVMDDVVYVGMPACEEHLKAQYLIFESNFDGDLDTYLKDLAEKIPNEVNAIWQHCVGYPGTQDLGKFKAYMKKCQLETTFFFADVNDKTVQQTLLALRTQKAVSDFMEEVQGMPAEELQRAFVAFSQKLRESETPPPGLGPARFQPRTRKAVAQSYE